MGAIASEGDTVFKANQIYISGFVSFLVHFRVEEGSTVVCKLDQISKQ